MDVALCMYLLKGGGGEIVCVLIAWVMVGTNIRMTPLTV